MTLKVESEAGWGMGTGGACADGLGDAEVLIVSGPSTIGGKSTDVPPQFVQQNVQSGEVTYITAPTVSCSNGSSYVRRG